MAGNLTRPSSCLDRIEIDEKFSCATYDEWRREGNNIGQVCPKRQQRTELFAGDKLWQEFNNAINKNDAGATAIAAIASAGYASFR